MTRTRAIAPEPNHHVLAAIASTTAVPAAVADVASELLAKQRLNIGFVVNDKNKQTHLSAPALLVAAMRGRITLNSVNSPGCVSTSINPASNSRR